MRLFQWFEPAPSAPYPLDEDQRLEAIRKYRIVDTEPEPQFDRIVNMNLNKAAA